MPIRSAVYYYHLPQYYSQQIFFTLSYRSHRFSPPKIMLLFASAFSSNGHLIRILTAFRSAMIDANFLNTTQFRRQAGATVGKQEQQRQGGWILIADPICRFGWFDDAAQGVLNEYTTMNYGIDREKDRRGSARIFYKLVYWAFLEQSILMPYHNMWIKAAMHRRSRCKRTSWSRRYNL